MRPLGPTEACIWYGDRASRFNFVMIAHLRGPLEPAHIEAALADVVARHPLLRAAIVERARWPWFEAREGAVIPLRCERGEGSGWIALAEEEVERPFDTTQAPLARCRWIEHGGERSTLLFTFHHTIGDGISGTYVLRDLCEAVGRHASRGEQAAPPREALALQGPIEQHLPPEVRGARLWLGYLGAVASMLAWMLRRGRTHGVRPDRRRLLPSQRRARVIARALEPDEVEALVASSRAQDTTVHGALAAAIMSAVARDHGRRRALLFAAPINLRARMAPPVEDDVGLFVSLGASMHRVDGARERFWDLAREHREALTSFIETGRPFTLLPVQSKWMAPLHRWLSPERFSQLASVVQLPGVGLTNIGRVTIEARHGELEVEGLSFAVSLGALGDFGVTAATMGGALRLNFIVMEPAISREHGERIADEVVRLVREVALSQAS